jgi:hypothetical protein
MRAIDNLTAILLGGLHLVRHRVSFSLVSYSILVIRYLQIHFDKQ